MVPAAQPRQCIHRLQQLGCWLVVVALLLRALWLPYHLATEPHATGHGDLLSWSVVQAGHVDEVHADAAPEDPEVPHSAHDHQRPKHHRIGDEAPIVDDGVWLACGGDVTPPRTGPPVCDCARPADTRAPHGALRVAAARPRAPPVA